MQKDTDACGFSKKRKQFWRRETENYGCCGHFFGDSIYLDLSEGIDVEAEKVRLSRELERLNRLVFRGEKVGKIKFVNSALERWSKAQRNN